MIAPSLQLGSRLWASDASLSTRAERATDLQKQHDSSISQALVANHLAVSISIDGGSHL